MTTLSARVDADWPTSTEFKSAATVGAKKKDGAPTLEYSSVHSGRRTGGAWWLRSSLTLMPTISQPFGEAI